MTGIGELFQTKVEHGLNGLKSEFQVQRQIHEENVQHFDQAVSDNNERFNELEARLKQFEGIVLKSLGSLAKEITAQVLLIILITRC